MPSWTFGTGSTLRYFALRHACFRSIGFRRFQDAVEPLARRVGPTGSSRMWHAAPYLSLDNPHRAAAFLAAGEEAVVAGRTTAQAADLSRVLAAQVAVPALAERDVCEAFAICGGDEPLGPTAGARPALQDDGLLVRVVDLEAGVRKAAPGADRRFGPSVEHHRFLTAGLETRHSLDVHQAIGSSAEHAPDELLRRFHTYSCQQLSMTSTGMTPKHGRHDAVIGTRIMRRS
eukprot:scaffold3026_cov221-Pinguiococcus_pyrenoidosus.AAC.9